MSIYQGLIVIPTRKDRILFNKAGQVLLQEVQPRHLQRLLQVCQTLRMLKKTGLLI